MFLHARISKPLFWAVMGIIYAVSISGIRVWLQDAGIIMAWWQWSAAILWYGLLSLCLAAGFTLIGENEPKAGCRLLGASLPVVMALGAGMWVILI
jgi:hypothetical protein